MLIKVDRKAYSSRNYFAPDIAKVTRWDNGRPEMAFGSWYGNSLGGHLEIEASIDDIVRYGQKDCRDGRKTENVWAIVRSNGNLEIVTESQARAHWQRCTARDGSLHSQAIDKIKALMDEHGISVEDLR